MKKMILCITLFVFSFLHAQVFNTAQTLRQGKFALGLEPTIYDHENDDETSLFIHGGYGINRGTIQESDAV